MEKWSSEIPTKCQICGYSFQKKDNFIDGPTNPKYLSPWAIICEKCWGENKLGIGFGQKYKISNGTSIQ